MSLLEQYIGLLFVLALIFLVLLFGSKAKDDGPSTYMTQDEREHIRILQVAMRDYRRKCYTRYYVQKRRKV